MDEEENLEHHEEHHHDDHPHHGHLVRIRRRRKAGAKRPAKLNLTHIIIALIVGILTAAYIVSQNHENAPPPPQALNTLDLMKESLA